MRLSPTSIPDPSFPATSNYGDANSLSLSAGDWDITFQLLAIRNTGTWTRVDAGISANAGNDGSGMLVGDSLINQEFPSTTSLPGSIYSPISNYRVSLGSTTTYFGKVRADYSAGQPQYTYRLSARRIR